MKHLAGRGGIIAAALLAFAGAPACSPPGGESGDAAPTSLVAVNTARPSASISEAPGTSVPGGFGPRAQPNPALGPLGTATMHGDAETSDTTPHRGPGAGPVTTRFVALASACPTILQGADGFPQALCTTIRDRTPTAHLLDPATGEPLASLPLTRGSLLGGVYAYLDDRDRLVQVDGDGDLVRVAHDRNGPGGAWRLTVAERTPLAAAVERFCGTPRCDAVTSVMPDHDGRVWFATGGGVVGYLDPATGRTPSVQLPGEQVANSIATSAQGTAVTTDHALYLFATGPDGSPQPLWRRPYDRGPARKPGQLSWGSGASPTFFGPTSGNEYLTITDNASPRPNLLVHAVGDGRLVCTVPVLGPGADGTENSPVGSGRAVFVAGTYGYPYPALPEGAGPSDPAEAPFAGGLTRVDVRAGGDGCEVRWTVPVRSAAVPRLSLADGRLYTFVRTPAAAAAATPDAGPDAFAFAVVDPATGAVVATAPEVGRGLTYDTLQMVGTITAEGVLYQGTVTGILRVAPP